MVDDSGGDCGLDGRIKIVCGDGTMLVSLFYPHKGLLYWRATPTFLGTDSMIM